VSHPLLSGFWLPLPLPLSLELRLMELRLDLLASGDPGPSELVLLSELRVRLESAISSLGASQRCALELRMGRMRYRGIGEVLGITDTAARMRVYRARKKLRARKRLREVMGDGL